MKRQIYLFLLVIAILVAFSSCDNQTEHIHSFAEWKVIDTASCTSSGVEARYCSCGEKQTEIIPATGHMVEIIPAKSSTCEQEGLTEGKRCSVCNVTILDQQPVAILEHSYGEWTLVDNNDSDASCGSDIKYNRSCENCGFNDTKIEYAPDHEWENVIYPNSTLCQYSGCYDYVIRICIRCKTEEIKSGEGHIEGDWVIEVEPGCMTDGLKSKYCQRGNELICQETIPATGHQWEACIYPSVHSCEFAGCYDMLEKMCMLCGEEVIKPGQGHIESNWVTNGVASCTEDQYSYTYCLRGGDVLSEQTIKALGHKYDASGLCAVCGQAVGGVIPDIPRDPIDFGNKFESDEE